MGASKYVLSSKMSETLDVLPLPLSKIRHLTTSAKTCTRAEAHVFPKGHLLSSCLPCVFPLEWDASPAGGFRDDNTRTITLDVLAPPWNKRTRIEVVVNPSVDITKLLTFLSKLQNGAAALLGGVPDADEGTGVSMLE